MRAGTLSDHRVLALLRRHFVCVHLPELVTRHLIEDPADLALIERYDRECRASKRGWPGLHGGEREVFLAPDGELLDVFLSLNVGTQAQRQYTLVARATPEVAVRRFFAAAKVALRHTTAGVPDDFAALRDGTHPAVEAIAALVPDAPAPPDDARQHVAVHVRNDLVMYESLAASSWFSLDRAQARAILPDPSTAGQTNAWPRELVLALARAAYPRGAGVLLDLADESIEGDVTTSIELSDLGVTVGTFTGQLTMTADTPEERGRRSSYRPFRSLTFALVGDFAFDATTGRFTAFRLASTSADLRCASGKNEKALAYELGAELRR